MPTYEYHCDACGNDFEQFQSIMAAPIKKCPKCGKNKVRRLISAGAGVIFKGSGFYTTDYRSEGYEKAAKAESGDGTSNGETKSDNKPDDAKPADAKPAAADTKTESKPAATESKPATKAESKPAKSAKK
jgi:putative FmdB family regulatory protein